MGAFRMPGASSRVTRRHPVHKDIPSQALLLVLWKRSVHMRNRIIIACILWISVCAAVALAGCSAEGRSTTYGLAERDTLRIKLDSAHERIWVLDLDGVRVYDSSRKRAVSPASRKALAAFWLTSWPCTQ